MRTYKADSARPAEQCIWQHVPAKSRMPGLAALHAVFKEKMRQRGSGPLEGRVFGVPSRQQWRSVRVQGQPAPSAWRMMYHLHPDL